MKTTFVILATLALAASSQAAVISVYDLQGTAGFGLLPGNEPGTVTGGTGGEFGAGIFLDDGNDADPNTNFLTVTNIGWGSSQGFVNTSSTVTASHIHGPTAANNGNGFTQTTGVFINLTRSDSAVTGGTFTNSPIPYTAAQVLDLNNGKHYINIHTSNNTGGEMRGFFVQVPEPTTAMLGAVGLMLLGRRRRN